MMMQSFGPGPRLLLSSTSSHSEGVGVPPEQPWRVGVWQGVRLGLRRRVRIVSATTPFLSCCQKILIQFQITVILSLEELSINNQPFTDVCVFMHFTLNVWMACWCVSPRRDSPFTSRISSPTREKNISRQACKRASRFLFCYLFNFPKYGINTVRHEEWRRLPSFSRPSAAAAPWGKIVLTKIPMWPRAESWPPTILNPRPWKKKK